MKTTKPMMGESESSLWALELLGILVNIPHELMYN
jgi:hypothetical protein